MTSVGGHAAAYHDTRPRAVTMIPRFSFSLETLRDCRHPIAYRGMVFGPYTLCFANRVKL